MLTATTKKNFINNCKFMKWKHKSVDPVFHGLFNKKKLRGKYKHTPPISLRFFKCKHDSLILTVTNIVIARIWLCQFINMGVTVDMTGLMGDIVGVCV